MWYTTEIVETNADDRIVNAFAYMIKLYEREKGGPEDVAKTIHERLYGMRYLARAIYGSASAANAIENKAWKKIKAEEKQAAQKGRALRAEDV